MKGHSQSSIRISHPVLGGLEVAGITGKHLAEIADVSASTVSKWRSGAMVLPASTLVFLTLVLADLVEDMETLERRLGEEGCVWNDAWGEQLQTLRNTLREQEIYNSALSPTVVRDGASRFRIWLETDNRMNSPKFDDRAKLTQ